MKNLLPTAFALILIVVVLIVGIHKQLEHECLSWENQANTYADFYATQWQVDQCADFGVDLTNYSK